MSFNLHDTLAKSFVITILFITIIVVFTINMLKYEILLLRQYIYIL